MFPLQQRELLLASPFATLRSSSASAASASSASTSLRLAAEWNGSAAVSPPSVPFGFRPLFSNPRCIALGQHRFYPCLILAAFFVQIAIDLQTWLPAYAQIGTMCALELTVNLPLTLVECTRLDRTLLRRLARSWSYFYLIANHALAILMQFLLLGSDGGGAEEVARDVGFRVLANLFWARLSVYIMSMDALVGVGRRWKLCCLFGFVVFLVEGMVQDRRSRASESDMQICLIQCTTARSIQAAAMLNLAIFMVKFMAQLIRSADAVVILSPAVALKQGDDMDAEGGSRFVDGADAVHINEAIL